MNIQEYCQKVNSGIKHITLSERNAISKELADHFEDSVFSLIESGYSKEDAETLAINSMGEPSEVAKEYQKAYSLFWLIANKLIRITIFSLLIILALSLPGALDNEDDLFMSFDVFIECPTNTIVGNQNLTFGKNELDVTMYEYLWNDTAIYLSNLTVSCNGSIFNPKYDRKSVLVYYETNTHEKELIGSLACPYIDRIVLTEDDEYIKLYFELSGTDISSNATFEIMGEENENI